MRKVVLLAVGMAILLQLAAVAATVASANFKTLSETGQRAFQNGRFGDAEAAFKQALIAADALAPDQAGLAKAIAFTNLGATYMAEDKLPEAEQAYKQSVTLKEKALGKNHALVADSLNHYAACLRRQKRPSEAESLQMRAELIQMQNMPATAAASPAPSQISAATAPAAGESQPEPLAKNSHLQTFIGRIVQQTLNDKEKMWNPETSESVSWKSDKISGARIASGDATYDFIKDMRYFEDRYRLSPRVVERMLKTLYDGGAVVEFDNGWLVTSTRELSPRVWHHGMRVDLEPRYGSAEHVYMVHNGRSEFLGTVVGEKF